MKFYDAHWPWQRGTNENTDGLLPDYFPKSADLRDITAEELRAAADEVNTRPRKSPGWARPADLFANIIMSPTA